MRSIAIMMTRGYTAWVDEADAQRVMAYRWWPSPQKRPEGLVYAYTQVKKRSIYLHRFILNALPGAQVDHADHDGLNCRRGNLRLATQTLSNANCRSKIGKSGFRGVHASNNESLPWRASIEVNGIVRRAGSFRTREEAARAYDLMAIEAFGEFATLNFPVSA